MLITRPKAGAVDAALAIVRHCSCVFAAAETRPRIAWFLRDIEHTVSITGI
jgi:hypothetical protein